MSRRRRRRDESQGRACAAAATRAGGRAHFVASDEAGHISGQNLIVDGISSARAG